MSAPDPGVQLGTVAAHILELCALRATAAGLAAITSHSGLSLPALGRIAPAAPQASTPGLALCVRPGRWLLLWPDAAPYAGAERWSSASAGPGVTIDLSSALAALHLSGPSIREMLARGCRLDLDPGEFPAGTAAATHMAQVSVIIAALPSGMLLLTPSSTARHVREWLASTARPFGFAHGPASGVGDLFWAGSVRRQPV